MYIYVYIYIPIKFHEIPIKSPSLVAWTIKFTPKKLQSFGQGQ